MRRACTRSCRASPRATRDERACSLARLCTFANVCEVNTPVLLLLLPLLRGNHLEREGEGLCVCAAAAEATDADDNESRAFLS